MGTRDVFSSYHPIVNFLYFGLVLLFSMFFMHPACLVISMVSALVYRSRLKETKTSMPLRFVVPMAVLAAVLNPLFNHEGATILGYLPSGNPLTLESMLYGIASAMLLACVIVWFSCYNEVMTSDKFVYLFGRIIPSLSLILSMTMRFIPRFSAQLKQVRQAQACIGRDMSDGRLLDKVRNALTILSIMISWSLENAIETADSMKSRAYGLPGRTAFSIYSFEERDKYALIWFGFCGIYVISGWISGMLKFNFYPVVKAAPISAFSVSFMIVYLALCLTPVILDVWEEKKWKRLQSEI